MPPRRRQLELKVSLSKPELLPQYLAAEYLNLAVSTFRRHVRTRVPAVLVGTRPFWRRADLDAWMERQTRLVPDAAGQAVKGVEHAAG